MSTRRRTQLYDHPVGRDEAGNRLCRWCHKPVPRPRLNWCSDACVDEYRVISDPAYARQRVFERDRGVCALCHTDTEAVRRQVDALREEWRKAEHPSPAADNLKAQAVAVLERAGAKVSEGIVYGWVSVPHLWEADHIQPVVEGGGETGLENLRTLCRSCHRRETAKLARRRAFARKRQLVLFDPGAENGGAVPSGHTTREGS